VHKFDLRAFQREPHASAVCLGSLAPKICVKFENFGQNLRKTSERKACLCVSFIRVSKGDKFGPNAMERSVHKFFLGALQRKTRASAVSLGSLAMENML